MPRYKVNGKVYNLPEEKVEDFLIAYPEAVLLEEQEELGKASDVVVKDAAVTSSPEQASESTELEQVDISSELEDPKPTRIGRAQIRAKELESRDKAVKEQDWFNNFASNVKSPRFSDLNQDQVLNIQNKAIEELTSKYKDEEGEYSFDETDIRLKAASIFENKVLPKVSLEKDTDLEKFVKEKAPILNPYADFISDIYTAGVQGFSTSGLVDPTFELLKKGSGSSDEDIVKWIDANKKVAAENMQSDEMRDFNRIYKENGSGVFGFIKGIANNPSIMPSLLVSSVVTQFSSLRSEEVALAAAAGAGTGAIAGTVLPGAGTAAGAIGGAIGGGSAAMEASLTFSELLQEEIGEDLNLEAVKSLFKDENKVADLKSKAIKRGIAIGLVEGLTGSIAKGVTGKVLKAGLKKPVATTAGVGVEAIGGGLGEVAGRLAADQKMDVAEIGFEAVTGTTTAPITVGSELINLDNKIANYKINKELKNTEFNNIEQAFSPQSITTEAQIKISQNKKAESVLDAQLKKSVIKGDLTQQQANDTKTNFLETQAAVNNIKPLNLNESDQAKTIDLIKEKKNLQQEIKKVNEPSLTESQSERINEINNSLKDISKKAKAVETAKIKKLVQNLEEVSLNTMSTDEIQSYLEKSNLVENKEQAIKQSEEGAFIIQNPKTGKQEIIVNKDLGSIADPSHEALHAIIYKTIKSNPEAAINLGKALQVELNKIDENLIKDSGIKNRLELYKSSPESVQMEEVLTLFSDAIRTENIKFNDTIFTKIGDFIRQVLQKAGIKAKFNKSRDVFNFVKDYQKSVEKGKLTRGQVRAAKEGVKGALIKEAVKDTEVTIKESKANKELGAEIKALVPKGTTKRRYDSRVIGDVYAKLVQGNTLDGLINGQLNKFGVVGDNVYGKPKDVFLEDVKAQLYEKSLTRFNPETNDDLGGFVVNELIRYRIGDVVNRYKKEAGVSGKSLDVAAGEAGSVQEVADDAISIEEQIDTADTVSKEDSKLTKATKILSKEQYNEASEIIKEKIKDIDPKNLSYKKVGGFITDILSYITSVPADKILDSTKNLSQGQVTTAAMFIEKNIDYIRRTLPEGAVLGAATEKLMGTSTGVPSSVLKRLYDKNPRIKKGAGLSPWTLKKGLTNNYILEAIGRPKGVEPKPISPRSPEGQVIKGILNIVDKNITNELVRTVESDLTLEQKQDVAAGKSRMMFSKGFNLGLENGSNVDNITSILFSKSARKKYEQVLKAKRPELKDIPEQVDNLINWADSLDIKDDKKAKYKKLGLFYMANGYAIFPEDGYKVTESIRLAAINKIDPYSFKNPNELIEKYEKTTKIAKINPDSVSEFSNKEEIAGLTIYDVEDSKKGQEAVRKIVDSNWGKKSNPWCLVARVDGNLAESFDLWKGYNKEGNGFKIAFNNGKLNSFRDGNDMQWWDRMDKPQKGPALKIKADPNGLIAEGYIDLKNGTEVIEGYKKDYKKGDLTIQESYTKDKKLVEKYTFGKNKFSDKSLIAEYSFQTLDGDDYIETESKYNQDNSEIINTTRKFLSPGNNLHKKTLRKRYYDKNRNIIDEVREKDILTGVITEEIIFTDNNTGYGTFNVYKAETINGKKNVSIDERKRFIFSDNPFKFSKSLSIEKSLIQDFISQKPGKVSARKQNSYARTIKELLEYGGVNGVESFERAVELGNYTKDELDLINFVFEGRDWLFGIFQDDKTQNQGIKLEKLVKVAIKKLGLKDVNLDLSEGGFSSGVDIVLSVKDKKLNIELKLNEKARVGSFTIKRNGDVFSYTKGIEGIETKLPAMHKAIQDQLRGDKYQKAWKKYTEEGMKIGKKLLESEKVDIETYVNEETGQLVGPKEVFDYLKDPKKGNYQKDLTIKINQVDGKPIDQKIIELLYNNKDVYDINFGGVGMFALGESISGRPELDANVEVRIVTSRASSNGIYRSIQRATPFILDINNTSDLDLTDLSKVQPNIEKLVESISDKSSSKFSKAEKLDKTFNDILEKKTGIPSMKRYGIVEAITKGSNKGRFNFFIPPSAEDFVGLLYPTLGKGKIGDAQMSWYKKNLIDPYAEGMNKLSKARVYITNTYNQLKKQLDIVPKNLTKKVGETDYTKEQAVRVYIWRKQKMEVPGMSKKDVNMLADYVASNDKLQSFADQLINLQLGDGYAKPKVGWPAGTITTDILEGLNTTKRAKYLSRWQQNVDAIFSEDNLNKLQAAYGVNYRKALEGTLERMKTGRNRNFEGDSTTGRFTDWLTGSVGAIMFFNTRSAVLQTISAANYINFEDNNIFAAGKAFANQKQYWSDFMKLINSDFLKERRGGLRMNVNEADISDMAKKGGARGVISKLLELGFTPTQVADSFAIASGGSTFYRNRINTYLKEKDADGNNIYTKKQAEKKAFEDFRESTEESQQSSRADRISQQQASPLGRIVLAFANAPAQYARIIKKAVSDLKNGRGNPKANISRIIYYGAVQNLIFNALQQALFATAFGDEEPEDKEKEKKYIGIANGMLDSILRGSGIGGAIVSVGKNTLLKLVRELEKDRPKLQNVASELLKISPAVSAKYSRVVQAGKSYDWNKQEMKEKGLSLDNPAFLAGANVVSALTNIPLDRAIKKANNVVSATSQDLETWERLALLGGWSSWELGIKKEDKKEKKKPKSKIPVSKVKVRR